MIGEHFEQVLAAARTGAPWALQGLYEDLAPVVGGYLRLQGLREVEDHTSEVFLGVFRDLSAFAGAEPAFRSWVFTIAHRRMVDERRRQGRRPDARPLEDADQPLGGDVETEALDVLGGLWVSDALAELTDEQRQVVTLRIIADLSVEEVAAIVGKRPGAVRVLQHRAIERLRRALERGRITDPRRT
ncbi:MAG: RNA polymerase sigma factor [Nitriliruptor sp.]|uniref:RNA polymerase sigma factor n=1 Tax=Nitriliruptor sp. TaxID=2448056 RepID=UPI00349FD93F